MKAAHIIAASLACGVQPVEASLLNYLLGLKSQERIKQVQSDDEKAYFLNKAEQKRNLKNMKRMVKL